MDANMANSLVVVLLLLLLESTVETVSFQQCCPEDDKHLFIYKQMICNSSQTLGLVCNNNSGLAVLMEHDRYYWFTETNDSVIVGSKYFGMVFSRESFCVANVTPLYDNWKTKIYSDGIVLCTDREPSGTYLGPEILSYVVCTLISGIGCLLTFLTYTLVPALRRDLLNKCLICTFLCSTFAYVLFAITMKEVHRLSRHYCAYQLLFLLFWGVAAVFWTNVVSFHIWRTVVFKRFPINEARLLKVYLFWGWGIPLILLLIATSLEAFAVGGGMSFLTCVTHSTYAFILITVPCPFLLFFNLLYFIWTIWKLCKQGVPSTADLKFTRFQRLRYKCFLYLKLFLMMGIPWLVWLIPFLPETIRMLLESLTLLQGLFFFLVLVVFQKKAYLGLAEQFAKWGCPCPFVTTNLAAPSNEEPSEDGNNVDAQKDAAVDAQKHAAVDAQMDAAVDAQMDAAVDVQMDAAVDVQMDAAVFSEKEIKTES